MFRTIRLRLVSAFALALAAGMMAAPLVAQGARFEVTVAPSAHQGPLTGRLIVAVSQRAEPEPRYLISPQGPAIFAVDLEGVHPGDPIVVDDQALGYPFRLDALEAGEYTVQAIVNVYEQVNRSDGHSIWVPMNDGTIEFFNTASGNIYSDPQTVTLGNGVAVPLEIAHVIPDSPVPEDTEWVKRVRIRSEKLTRFWGRPIYIHATVLLPKGFDDHPEARYPAVFTMGHSIPFSFTTDSTRVRRLGEINPVTGVETGFDFYREWISDTMPRIVAISFQQQTPYFPDSYSVNSANNGPYGDAMIEEVIPELERRFRLIGEPYARLVEGASTGGWQTLALQLKHPDFFGGAWILQPDPIDFRSYQLVDIYQDTSAFTLPAGQFIAADRPFRRTVEGQVVWSVRQLSRFEEVLGTRGRSGFQLGAWQAIYGPVGPDGYPTPLWDNLTGTIDHDVAQYMREHGYDLRAYAEHNWTTLGPKLRGKLHFFSGDMDDFYLNVAVYDFEEWLRSTDPNYAAEFTYGRPKKGHSWHEYTWAQLVRRMGRYVQSNAPRGVDTESWNY